MPKAKSTSRTTIESSDHSFIHVYFLVKKMEYTTKIVVHTEKGRGLVAASDLPARFLLFEAPCIVVPKEEYLEHARHTVLEHYLFHCPGTDDMLLALDRGSLFNHDPHPNVDFRVDSQTSTIHYYTAKPVAKGQELCIYYGAWGKRNYEQGDEEEEETDEEQQLNRMGSDLLG